MHACSRLSRGKEQAKAKAAAKQRRLEQRALEQREEEKGKTAVDWATAYQVGGPDLARLVMTPKKKIGQEEQQQQPEQRVLDFADANRDAEALRAAEESDWPLSETETETGQQTETEPSQFPASSSTGGSSSSSSSSAEQSLVNLSAREPAVKKDV